MDQLLQNIEESERIGHDILSIKGEIVALDYKRNKNREALRAISKKEKSSNDKTWISCGGIFIKCKTDAATKMIQEDQKALDNTINKMRDEIKDQTKKLLVLEGKPVPASLTDLKPLSSQEIKGMNKLLPTVSGVEYR
jgi:chaperonin cofactor prefoldin